ncbi:MAG: nucleotidyltransferase domain-containing protein [Enterococcus sp.]|nr:nucleotidyltransferase domain-containing protein [Enterococcus sp.]
MKTNPETLLLTNTGSKLYGLDHAGSDNDTYRIIPTINNGRKRNARQIIKGDEDQITMDFKTFARFAYDGQPQALEAMFSPIATIDRISEFRNSFYAGLNYDAMIGRYRRTATAFAHGNFKHRRHALRLILNLEEAMRNRGYFNPRLSPENRDMITEMAMDQNFATHLQSLSIYDLHLNYEEINANLRAELEA